MKKKYVVSIGAGWQQERTIKAFSSHGYPVIAIDGNKEACGLKFSDISKVLDITNVGQVIEFLKNYSLMCAIAPNNDAGQITSALINERFSLPGLRREHLNITLNKFHFRSILESCGVDQPKYFEFSNIEDFLESYRKTFPNQEKVVIKPNRGSGSRGVFFVDRISGYIKIERQIKSALEKTSENFCICEEFLFGEEYSIEVLSRDYNVHEILLVTKRHMNSLASALAIEEVYCNEAFKNKIQALVNKILNFVKFYKGITHLELIVCKGILFPIDIAFRGGGYWIADVLLKRRISQNINLMFIKSLLNEEFHYAISKVNKGVLIYPRKRYSSEKIRKSFIKEELKIIDQLKLTQNFEKEDNSDGSRYAIELWEKSS